MRCPDRSDQTHEKAMTSDPLPVPHLFDRRLLAARIERARRLGPVSFLLDRVDEDIDDRLAMVKRNFNHALDLWTPGAGLEAPRHRLKALRHVEVAGNGSESLSLESESLDLVLSALSFQFVNDLPGVLAQLRRALRPDGLLLAAMVGGDSLHELRHAFAVAEVECEGGMSPRVVPFADVRELGSLLQRAGFALPVVDRDRIIVRYDDAFALMADLRRMGATNLLNQRRRTLTRPRTMVRMAEVYRESFADPDGRLRASFEIVWLSGWAPHDSQQKPLKPGSARMSLEQAVLKAGETSKGG